MLGAVILHPDASPAIAAVMPEPIIKQDGAVKNDCERNAARYASCCEFRKVHPHLPVIVVEDAGSARRIFATCRIITCTLSGRQGRRSYLFKKRCSSAGRGVFACEWVPVNVATTKKQDMSFRRAVRDVPLNESNDDMPVTFVRCLEAERDGQHDTDIHG